jgi:hypothetical protein
MNEFYVWMILGLVYILCGIFTVLICMKEKK